MNRHQPAVAQSVQHPISVPIAAEAAFGIGLASLLAGVLVVYLVIRRQSKINPALMHSPGDRPYGDGIASLQKRREVLAERLDIDKPHVCSQYMIPCTSWSFCASSADKNPDGKGAPPTVQRLVPMRDLLSKVNGLPVVHRSGMDDCQFRFTAPFARLEPEPVKDSTNSFD